MRKAEDVLQALHCLGKNGKPIERIYRQLYNPNLYLAAYDKIGRHPGAMTPGIDGETADGTSLETFAHIMHAMRHERYYFKPVKRVYIPKKNGKQRPLGLPSFSDKLVQELLRMLLEAYYEPIFHDCSHGFRPGRGCHTALGYIHRKFQGAVWFIEGDIKGCFDHIDHAILMHMLARRIRDGRILELIRRYLKAGYMEDWEYHRSYSGTPQGGILSPLLANIYLHELDTFIAEELIPRFSRGKKRRANLEYARLGVRINSLKRKGRGVETRELVRRRRSMPSTDRYDPGYRRLRCCRYADDFVLGFVGPRAEARQIKTEIASFLKERLNLDLSDEKTLITHARMEHAVFLNYDLQVYWEDTFVSTFGPRHVKRRGINGKIRLGIPQGVVHEKCRRYRSKGMPIEHTNMIVYSDAQIIATYQAVYRGIAGYYKYAVDRRRLGHLKYAMECSLVRTLMRKHRMGKREVYRKYKGTYVVDGYRYKTLEARVHKQDGDVVVIRWGAIPLRVSKTLAEPIGDKEIVRYPSRSDLVQRILNDQCQLCGDRGSIEIHHVRKLSDLRKRWQRRAAKPGWVTTMIALRRKTLALCRSCHREIHQCS